MDKKTNMSFMALIYFIVCLSMLIMGYTIGNFTGYWAGTIDTHNAHIINDLKNNASNLEFRCIVKEYEINSAGYTTLINEYIDYNCFIVEKNN